jgi:hypothetical protein
MSYDHGNYDYSHGVLPKTHFSECWPNVPNSGAMKSVEHPKDRHGYDRFKFCPKRKMSPYGNDAKGWCLERKQRSSTAVLNQCRSACKTSTRFRLKQETVKMLIEDLL